MAPMLSPLFESKPSERFVYASTWSERHAAYAAGLGTFGVCDGLITPKGKAMRVGSVIACLQVPPTPRPYADDEYRAYCLFYSQGLCGQCIPRCPVGALSAEGGHDKKKCRAHLTATRSYVEAEYGFLHPIGRRWIARELGIVADIALRYELDVVNIQYQAAAYGMHPAIRALAAPYDRYPIEYVRFLQKFEW